MLSYIIPHFSGEVKTTGEPNENIYLFYKISKAFSR